MKSYNTLYYLLTVLLIMGAFASMAQNSYGMQIISMVTIAFGLIFLIRFVGQLNDGGGSDKLAPTEYLSLFLLALIFTFRSFQVYFPYIEWLFGISGIVIAGIYTVKAIRHFRYYKQKNITVAFLLMIAYFSISFFSLAMVLFAFNPLLARYLGIFSLVLIAGFLFGGIFYGRFLVGLEKTSVFKVIAGFRDRFYLLLTLFVLFTLYVGLTGAGVLPRLYSDNYPQAYYKLVNEAETGKERPVEGKYQYERFKTAYDQFVEKNIRAASK
jgi:hypothetical protein